MQGLKCFKMLKYVWVKPFNFTQIIGKFSKTIKRHLLSHYEILNECLNTMTHISSNTLILQFNWNPCHNQSNQYNADMCSLEKKHK